MKKAPKIRGLNRSPEGHHNLRVNYFVESGMLPDFLNIFLTNIFNAIETPKLTAAPTAAKIAVFARSSG